MADEIIVDIEKRFPAGPKIRANFRLDLAAGSTAILFGPSGAGKTTLLRSIAGLERPDRGVIQFRDEVWLDHSLGICQPPEFRRVGLLFQEYALFPHLTVRRNIEYGIDHLSKPERRQVSDQMMQLFEINELADRYPREVSGGQAQRVALARAVAPQPRILLLDEPLAALDIPTRARLRTELRRLLELIQIPSLVVTHDRTEAIGLGHQIVVMAEGEVRQVGRVGEVFRRPGDSKVAAILGVETILQGVVIDTIGGLARVQVGPTEICSALVEEVDEKEKVLVCIRAEDVTLHRDNHSLGSARNHFAGTIESMESDGAVERVSLNCGFCLMAIITRSSREDMGLSIGIPVTASIKASAIHLIRLQA
jgi:molybdate transport system ATP-binding protein